MWVPWNLARNPLVPSVPLEGSDTVQGLRTLERLRAAELLSLDDPKKLKHSSIDTRRKRRSRYQRYKGPFIEYLGVEDFKRDGKSWQEFGGQNTGTRGITRCFDVAASLDLLAERVDENLVYYAGNYLRISLIILLLMTYLRPKSIVGIILIAYNIYSSYDLLVASQPGVVGADARQKNAGSNRTIFMAGVTWLAMVYSKCIPIISLALLVSLFVIMLHASLRRASSEGRYRGRKPISYSFDSVLRGLPRDSRTVFVELLSEMKLFIMGVVVSGKRWSTYYVLLLIDNVKGLFRRGHM